MNRPFERALEEQPYRVEQEMDDADRPLKQETAVFIYRKIGVLLLERIVILCTTKFVVN